MGSTVCGSEQIYNAKARLNETHHTRQYSRITVELMLTCNKS